MFVIFLTALIGAFILYTYILNTRHKNFPSGPISLPIVGTLYALGTQPHIKLVQMKKKYGSVIRIDFGSYLGIVLNDYKAIKEAFNLPAFNGRPEYGVIAHIRDNGNEGMIFVNGKTWEEQRKFIFDYLRIMRKDKNLFEAIILEQLHHLKKNLDGNIGKPFQKKNFFNTSAVAPLWTVLTGTSANPEDNAFKSCVDLMTKMAEKFSSAGAVYFMPSVCKLFPSLTGWNSVVDCATQNIDFVNSLLVPFKGSFSEDDDPKNLIEEYLHKIKNTEDIDSSFFGEAGDKNLTSVIWDMLLAGTETVSTAMMWFITLLSYHPDVQLKLQEEIDKVIGNKLPSLEDRPNLPYTEACIHEVLRFSALSPLSTPRATCDDVVFRGYFIPKGTVVVPNLYSALRDPNLFEDNPDSFLPERFLSKDGTSVLRDKTLLTNFVFGSGKRGCPGNSLAKDQMLILGIGLLQSFNFTLDPNVDKGKIETHVGGTLAPIYKPINVSKRCN